MNKYKTRDIVLAALLTALSLIITFSPFKVVIGPFSMTLGSHVPTMVAMFINPVVVLFTVIGSCVGFLMAIPGNFIVPLRAATHIIFALIGWYLINHKVIKNSIANIVFVAVLTGILHAVAEGIIVGVLTPIMLPNNDKALSTLVWTTIIGTIVHHAVDACVTIPVVVALLKAKLVRNFLNNGISEAEMCVKN